jgi:dimethylaniline monooxygenase (N-oxide forming)
MPTVAILGAGPAGLVAARYLLSEGLTPTLFERSSRIGGQWSGDPAISGIWPTMRTNTSRIMTAFSDLAHPATTPTYPTNQAMRDYLERYADLFNLTPHIRLSTPVLSVTADPTGGYTITTSTGEEHFDKVVIATGRYHQPSIPQIPGLDTFSGSQGIAHTFNYQHPETYRNLRVLVAGCSISALEIASDLATLGAASVVVTNRKQRYVLPKLILGVPTEHVAFTRFSALAEETFPPEAIAAAMKQFVLASAGSPDQFGAPAPPDNIFEANITQSQFFLPLVAEGRITVKPWITHIEGPTVHFDDGTSEDFDDGTSEDFDAILFGTGYTLNLPFLSEEIRQTLSLDPHHIDLYKPTFHPALPDLAFLGLLAIVGPYLPALELQARWIAYTLSGNQPLPPSEELEAGIAAYLARRGGPQEIPYHAAAILFARAAQVEPDPTQYPDLLRALYFGPLTPTSFRLTGRDAQPIAPQQFASESKTFGCIPTEALTPMQIGQLQALAAARHDQPLAKLVQSITEQPSPA